MSEGPGSDIWREGRGLEPFGYYKNERDASPDRQWLKRVQRGLKKGFIDMRVTRSLTSASELLAQGGGQEAHYSLSHGGLLTITDNSLYDERALKVEFDPEHSNGQTFTAYFDAADGLLATPGCHVQVGDFDSENYRTFNSSDKSLMDKSFSDIRRDLSIVQVVLDEAIKD